MKHSLQLTPSEIIALFKMIQKQLNNDTLIKEAYVKVADQPGLRSEVMTMKRIEEHIDFIIQRGAKSEFCEFLLKMISYLVKENYLQFETLAEEIKAILGCSSNTVCLGELSLEQNGTWVITWNLNNIGSLSALKFDPEVGEIVPESIIEIQKSTILLLANNANISALSLALTALETALWDHLAGKNIAKSHINIKYPNKVQAHLKGDNQNYLLSLVDHKGDPMLPPDQIDFYFEIFRTEKVIDKNHRILEIVLEDKFSDILSNGEDKEEKVKEVSGLSVALQRARKENLITAWDEYLDDTFRVLRNSIIHRPVNYDHVEVRTPYDTVKLSEFEENINLVMIFINRIFTYISDAYLSIRINLL